MLFIYICQLADFSHYSSSQASPVVNKSILSHPKMNAPHISITDVFTCLIQTGKKKEDLAPVALPHPTKWHGYFSPRGTWLHRPYCTEPSEDRVEGGHSHPKHTAEVKAQAKAHSQSSVSGSTEQEEKQQRVFPGLFYRRQNTAPSVPLALTNIVDIIF